MPVIETLTTELGFDIDEDTLEKFDKGLDAAVVSLTAVVVAAAAAGAAIFAFTNKTANSNDEIAKFAKRIDIDVEALQEWGFAARLNGGSIDSMNSSLENLNRIASETSRGLGAGVEVFGILGMSVTDANGKIKAADVLMLELSDSLNQLSTQAEKAELAQKLGIGPDVLLTLNQGSEAIRKQREEAKALGSVIDKDATGAAEKFVDSMLRVMSIVKGVSSAIGTKLIKQIGPMVDLFVDWFKANKELIALGLSQFLDTAIKSIRVIFSVLARVVGVVNSLVQAIGGWKIAIGTAAAAMLILNASALLMPALILVAGAAIFLLIEDIIKFAEGGDSAIGSLIEKFPLLEVPIKGLLSLLKLIVDGWKLIFTEGDKALEGLKFAVEDLGKYIQEKLQGPLATVFKHLVSALPGGAGLVLAANILASQGAPQIPATVGGNSSTINNSEGNQVTININGGNLASVKSAVKEALNEDYRNAATNLKSPVDL